jgi:hypothetical protein
MRIEQINKAIARCHDKKEYFNDKFSELEDKLESEKEKRISEIKHQRDFNEILMGTKAILNYRNVNRGNIITGMFRIYEMLSSTKFMFNIQYGKRVFLHDFYVGNDMVVLRRDCIMFVNREHYERVTSAKKSPVCQKVDDYMFDSIFYSKSNYAKEIIRYGKNTKIRKFLSSILKIKLVYKNNDFESDYITRSGSINEDKMVLGYDKSYSKLLKDFKRWKTWSEKTIERNRLILERCKRDFENNIFLSKIETISKPDNDL